ncbi:MAG: ferrous iron transport protein A [Firmicutes bacterium]|nr:ferrous iron transport protein A [Bacillota bacterium]
MTALSLAQPGKNYTIKWNVCQSNIAADVENLGLYPGETLFLISSYFGNVIINIRGKKLALNKETAFYIKV